MQYRQLGLDGDQVPVVGLGAWPLGGGMGQVDEATAIATIYAAIDQGITLIDTAQGYRSSESIIGKALKNGYRQRCFVASKVSFDYSANGIRSAIENSLRALQIETVDLYQIHSWRDDIPVEESMSTLAQLQQEGKLRYIGVSNYTAAQMARALKTACFHANQPAYNMLQRQLEGEDMTFCVEHGIGILAHSPLAKGLLSGKYAPGHQFPADDERARFSQFQGERFARDLAIVDGLKAVAAEKGISMVQMAIAWQLRVPAVTCVLVGAKESAAGGRLRRNL